MRLFFCLAKHEALRLYHSSDNGTIQDKRHFMFVFLIYLYCVCVCVCVPENKKEVPKKLYNQQKSNLKIISGKVHHKFQFRVLLCTFANTNFKFLFCWDMLGTAYSFSVTWTQHQFMSLFALACKWFVRSKSFYGHMFLS